MLSRRREIVSPEDASEVTTSRNDNSVNLVFKPTETLESSVDKMSQKYRKKKEDRMKAVKVRLTPEQIQQMQLNKLFDLAKTFQ